uniref:Bifunctional lysine-specific demethylase and histidyl-hydroxylase n=1 Tax=Ananas comosus var. bracteatus TaxID=296719 RepID=A0A6V7P5G6_ANACO|nr:unnamed protein product [Ananas comosus var. bracteatus]
MEEEEEARRKKRRKGVRKKTTSTSSSCFSSFDRAVFPLLLAAAVRGAQDPVACSLLRRFLRSQRLAIAVPPTSPSSNPLPLGFLSLLPLLLTSRCPAVVALSAEVVGAAALHSMEMNMAIASDYEVVKCLTSALGSRSYRVAKAACNAIMDLSSSPNGRERLRDSLAIQSLLCLYCQVESVHVYFDVPQDMDKPYSENSKGYSREKFLALILDAAMTLINTCNEDCSNRSSPELLKKFCLCCAKSGITFEFNLAETIFRLSMNQIHPAPWDSIDVRMTIFGGKESDFENFILNYWENSPLVLRGVSRNSEKANTIFSSVIGSFNPKIADNIIDLILAGLVTCPPIASDELDINCFLHEVKDLLGSPIVHGQDVRVLRTSKLNPMCSQDTGEMEEHFFTNDPFTIPKCKKAFLDGYTIALRGMEFRSDKVAAIAEALADLFGQPSVGVNVYLSPPCSQGLACHYDDHCVFVWQILGRKHWTVSTHPTAVLPRLYEPLKNLGLKSDSVRSMQMLIKEGDILYIPRGYAHMAHTIYDEMESQESVAADYSLHLTLAIEVELPFQWEGFAHIALYCWNKKQKKECHHLVDSNYKKPSVMFTLLLHIAIKLIADHDPVFRKACMIASKLALFDCERENHAEAFITSQKATFLYVIEKINVNCSFIKAFKCIELVVQDRNDSTLQWMRWLQHLPQDGVEDDEIDFNNLLGVLEDLFALYSNCIKEAIVEFDLFKFRFCRDVVYEEACESFNVLLEKYKKTRNQYMKGMLSLHRRL